MKVIRRLSMLIGLFGFVSCSPARAQTVGTASWYGSNLEGRIMANGQPFDPSAMTCAAWLWPLGTRLCVTYGNKSVIVTVTDRGPARRLRRTIDLSYAAFACLANPGVGLITVSVREAE